MRLSKGVTLIELVVIIVITGILASTGISITTHIAAIRSDEAVDTVVTHLRYMQTLAMTTHTRTWLVFEPGSNSYKGYIEDPDNPGRSHRSITTNPLNQKTFEVSFDSGSFKGVSLVSVDIGGDSEVAFDSFGTPYDKSETALTSDGTITFDGGRTIIITCETGYSYRNS